jgi:glyoxylase-like metal-dependent hydrolase (beta-lactamase superfamily II)
MKTILRAFLLAVLGTGPARLPALPERVETVAEGLAVVRGPVNGAILERGGKTLAVYGDPRESPASADTVLFTHHRRDVAWAGRALVERGAKAIVPAAEAELFTGVDAFWDKFVEGRFHDYAQQSTKILARPIPVAQAVQGSQTVDWEGVAIRVLDTPGPTRGSVSYVIETGGKKVAFTGDLIQGDGRLLEIFGLQDAIPEAKVGGYHGWAGRLAQVLESLRKIEAERPDVLVPARGPVIRDPADSIRRLTDRARAAYENYLSIDALRWYFKDDHILAKARRVLGPDAKVDWMPMAETRPLPPWIVAIGNTRVIVSEDKSGFLVDCGSRSIIDELKKLQAAGKLAEIKDLFITHYHDDHTDAASAFIKETGAKVHSCGSLRHVLEFPGDYRLPCLTPSGISVLGKHEHGDTWRWKEFQLSIFDFPGQTIHHNALLAKKDGGEAILFVGDSFTPSGVDDYCLQNRNLLHEGTGLLRCLDIVEKEAAGVFLINQHVEPAFRFDQPRIDRMREALRKRRDLLAALFPWDDPNFGIDEGWASVQPYAVEVSAGDAVALGLRIKNHYPVERSFQARIHAPEDLELALGTTASERIAPRATGYLGFGVRITAKTHPGVHVATFDVRWDGGELREWCEALVVVQPPRK